MFCQKDVLEPKLFKEGLQEVLAAIEVRHIYSFSTSAFLCES